MPPESDIITTLVYGGGITPRFTQDTPILHAVWQAYAEHADQRIELLLTPYQKSRTGQLNPGQLSKALRDRLDGDSNGAQRGKQRANNREAEWAIAYHQTTVVATLNFRELIRCVLPMTRWWQTRVFETVGRWYQSTSASLRKEWKLDVTIVEHPVRLFANPRVQAALVNFLTEAESRDRQGTRTKLMHDSGEGRPANAKTSEEFRIPEEIVWLVRVAGAIAWAIEHPDSFANLEQWKELLRPPQEPTSGGDKTIDQRIREDRQQYFTNIIQALVRLTDGMDDKKVSATDPQIYLVSRNRTASICDVVSSSTIKADAARRVFQMSCRNLTWAVIDSGIDASHPAFLTPAEKAPAGKKKRTAEAATNQVDDSWWERTRVKLTYDFSIIRKILRTDSQARSALPDRIKRRLDKDKTLKKRLEDNLKSGAEIDWGLLLPLIEVPHTKDEYIRPTSEHGTHVAGIIGARLEKEDAPDSDLPDDGLHGICPDINLYDLRVFGLDGDGDEFTVMAAMQFVRYLNLHKSFRVVHGVNLSLSIPHDPKNYACGRTPVCDECHRLIGDGLVVVVAAGNQGANMTAGGNFVSFQQMTITDPGNADEVITVGSTHSEMPHTYGVSYFSSRGPTGDGRNKPDLVAPGEKILSCVPNGQFKLLDGTSMAAPHVSGAAALLMAQNVELVGQPRRIKEILCNSATDLGRERYFQGHGLIDILRALQSI